MASQSNPLSFRRATDEGDPMPVLHRTMLSLVRRRGGDLTARQLGVFLSVYLGEGPHTVRGLAAQLNICKPAVTRALDRLGELDLVRREVDPRDRRSVLAQETDLGREFMGELRRATGQAAAAPGRAASTVPAAPWPRAASANRATPGHRGFAADPCPG